MNLTNAEITAIQERYKQCIHESDYADVADHIPALLDTILELRAEVERLREWLVVRAKQLESVADDPALLPVDRWKVNGMHRAFTQIASIIESGALPND